METTIYFIPVSYTPFEHIDSSHSDNTYYQRIFYTVVCTVVLLTVLFVTGVLLINPPDISVVWYLLYFFCLDNMMISTVEIIYSFFRISNGANVIRMST